MLGLAQELGRLEDHEIGPLDSILESVDALGVGEEEWDAFLTATLLALRGWAGMIHHVEHHGDRVVRRIPRGKLGGLPGDPAFARPLRLGSHRPAPFWGFMPRAPSSGGWRGAGKIRTGRRASSSARSWSSSSRRCSGSRPTSCTV